MQKMETRMLPRILFLTILLFLSLSRLEAQNIENEAQKFQQSFQGSLVDLTWLDDQARSELTSYYNSRQNIPVPNWQLSADDALYWLGDPTEIQKGVDEYNQKDGASMLTGPPDILPYLIDDVTNGNFTRHTLSKPHSLMDQSVISACWVIRHWAGFPKETREWAGDMGSKFFLYYYYGIGPKSKANKMMREWWFHNRDAVLARKYSEATWLPPEEERNVQPMSSAELQAIDHPQPSSKPVEAPHVIAQTSANNGGGVIWPIVILIVIVSSGFLLFRLIYPKKP